MKTFVFFKKVLKRLIYDSERSPYAFKAKNIWKAQQIHPFDNQSIIHIFALQNSEMRMSHPQCTKSFSHFFYSPMQATFFLSAIFTFPSIFPFLHVV